METVTVPVHTKAASTCYRLDLPGSNFLVSLLHRFSWVCYQMVSYLRPAYRVFLFSFRLLSLVDMHCRFKQGGLRKPCPPLSFFSYDSRSDM